MEFMDNALLRTQPAPQALIGKLQLINATLRKIAYLLDEVTQLLSEYGSTTTTSETVTRLAATTTSEHSVSSIPHPSSHVTHRHEHDCHGVPSNRLPSELGGEFYEPPERPRIYSSTPPQTLNQSPSLKHFARSGVVGLMALPSSVKASTCS